MRSVRHYQSLLFAGGVLIERVIHPKRNEIVSVAVDKERRGLGFPDLLQRRGFFEVEAYLYLRRKVCKLEERGLGQAERVAYLDAVFIPHRGVSAVRNGADYV